jgi:hypothetical protein
MSPPSLILLPTLDSLKAIPSLKYSAFGKKMLDTEASSKQGRNL